MGDSGLESAGESTGDSGRLGLMGKSTGDGVIDSYGFPPDSLSAGMERGESFLVRLSTVDGRLDSAEFDGRLGGSDAVDSGRPADASCAPPASGAVNVSLASVAGDPLVSSSSRGPNWTSLK